MIIAINYDLHRPGQNYEELYEAIKGLGDWWHHLGSTWLVDTEMTVSQAWSRIEPQIDQNDSFLLIGVTRDYSGWLPQEAWNWLNERWYKLAA